jgi:hypothetical protein
MQPSNLKNIEVAHELSLHCIVEGRVHGGQVYVQEA